MNWWEAAPALEMTVTCEGSQHLLRWRRDGIEPADHPELDAELALMALGGAPPACVSLIQLWDDAVTDGGFVGEWVDETRLNQAWFSWLSMALDRMRSEGFHEFLRRLPPARALRMGEFLDRFPLPWVDRAAAVVNEATFGSGSEDSGGGRGSGSDSDGDGVGCPLAPELLVTAAGNRLRRSFVDAVGGRQLTVGVAALVPLQLTIEDRVDPAVDGSLSGRDRGVSLTVSTSWLHRVWAAGAAVIDGRLTLSLDPGSPGGPNTARLITWDRTLEGDLRPRIETLAVDFDAGRWVPA